MSAPASFSSARPLRQILDLLKQEVADADAGFQIAQQGRWNALLRDRPLLAGYDRQANLGLTRVEIQLSLSVVRPGVFRRLGRRLAAPFSAGAGAVQPDITYRLSAPDDDAAAMRVSLVVERSGATTWTAAAAGSAEADAWTRGQTPTSRLAGGNLSQPARSS
jgi:hypothetical protein